MFIFSNLAISLDGKIATHDRSFFSLGTKEDKKEMQILRSHCDALLIGAATFRCYRKPSTISGKTRQPINIILSSNLEGISPHWEFFKKKGLSRILIVSHLTPPSRIKKYSGSSEICVLKKPSLKSPLALQIIDFLEQKGIRRLLIEGGGGVMWDFASLNLIDEYHVTLTPKIIGGLNAPTLVDGAGFNPKNILNLKLMQCRVVGGEIYLTYSKGHHLA